VKLLTAIFVVVILTLIGGATATATADRSSPSATTYQGKSAVWWAKRAVQARKDANALTVTVKQLRRSLHYNPTIDEAVKLAHIAYPNFTEARAWQIIEHESCKHCQNLGYIPTARTHAYNATPVGPGCHATGIVQFLDCTYRSTPYGKAGVSIYSPYASLLAAGWMHQTGRGREWAIGRGISGSS